MRRIVCAILIWPLATFATAETWDDAECGAFAEYVMDVLQDIDVSIVQGPTGKNGHSEDGCYMTDLETDTADVTGFRIKRVAWSGAGLQGWSQGSGWPVEVSLTLDGFYMQTRLKGFPAMEWATNIQMAQNTTDASLSATWNAESGLFSLRHLKIKNRDNEIWLSGDVSGLREAPLALSLGTLTIHDIRAELTFAGFFEDVLLTLLASVLLGNSEDPAADFAQFIARADEVVAALPVDQFSAGSHLATRTFLRDLPTPRGRVELWFRDRQGWGVTEAMLPLMQLANPTPEAIASAYGAALDDAMLSVSWYPSLDR